MSDRDRMYEDEVRRARWAAMDEVERREAAGKLRAEELHREFCLLWALLRRLAATSVRYLACLRTRFNVDDARRHESANPAGKDKLRNASTV